MLLIIFDSDIGYDQINIYFMILSNRRNKSTLSPGCLFVLLLAVLMVPATHQSLSFSMFLVYPQPFNKEHTDIFERGQLTTYFNNTEYLNQLSCMNNEYQVLEFLRKDPKQIAYEQINIPDRITNNNKFSLGEGPSISSGQELQQIIFQYEDQSEEYSITDIALDINVSPNKLPLPSLSQIDPATRQITLINNCPQANDITDDNFFNEVMITMKISTDSEVTPVEHLTFSFLMNCDKGVRHKKFEIGYLLISLFNSAIIIGVALHSRIWSIRYKCYPLAIELKWHRFLIFILVSGGVGAGLYFYAADQFKNANIVLRYLGLVVAFFFSFVCWDEILFLIPKLKKKVYRVLKIRKRRYITHLRICDVASVILSAIMFVIGLFTEGWIYNNILAVCICVGSIKLFKFRSMKQGFLSLMILVGIVLVLAVILHFSLDRSYNDEATELNSPLVLMVPDLITSLFKKCSWLPIFDVIVPGVFLSFLRKYDENYNTGWGGVYTTIGNLAFVLGTILWVVVEALYPFSVPFSLVSYVCLVTFVFLLAKKRNEFQTLWEGRFNGAMIGTDEHISDLLLEDDDDDDDDEDSKNKNTRKSFGSLIGRDVLDSVKYGKKKSMTDQSQWQTSKVDNPKPLDGPEHQNVHEEQEDEDASEAEAEAEANKIQRK